MSKNPLEFFADFSKMAWNFITTFQQLIQRFHLRVFAKYNFNSFNSGNVTEILARSPYSHFRGFKNVCTGKPI